MFRREMKMIGGAKNPFAGITKRFYPLILLFYLLVKKP
jgi:hypothetical protein